MTIEIIRFTSQHWQDIESQDATAFLKPLLKPEHIALLAGGRYAYTAVSGGRIVCCGGVVESGMGVGEAWTILAKTCRNDFMGIHHAVKRFLDICPLKRVEASVDCEFPAAHRWIKLLGFRMEVPRMENYCLTGNDYALYVRNR